jgi:hypothetical protein
MGVGGQRHAPAVLPLWNIPVQEAGWTPGPAWAVEKNLTPLPPGIRSPDSPAHSVLL